MQPISDLLIDRKRLKSKLTTWRMVALAGLFAVAVGVGNRFGGGTPSPIGRSYIAQISIADVMVDDAKRDAMMKEILEDTHAKAVIVQLDSPGGTTFGGETLYLQLKEMSEKKPVIGVMRTLCASACYMAAMGTNHVIARESTLTGSIGVLLQSVEVSRLAEKLGVGFVTIKSGEMKDAPSLSEPLTEAQRTVLSETILNSYEHFVKIIVENRKLDDATVRKLADGRVYTGSEAYSLKLIDGIGGTDEALTWLSTEGKIDPKLKIIQIEPERELDSVWGKFAQSAGIKFFGKSAVGLDGLVSIWHPAFTQ